MDSYTVIGIHDDGNSNRFAETYPAADPADAECLALAEHPDLLIAGVAVADGISVQMVDEGAECENAAEALGEPGI